MKKLIISIIVGLLSFTLTYTITTKIIVNNNLAKTEYILIKAKYIKDGNYIINIYRYDKNREMLYIPSDYHEVIVQEDEYNSYTVKKCYKHKL